MSRFLTLWLKRASALSLCTFLATFPVLAQTPPMVRAEAGESELHRLHFERHPGFAKLIDADVIFQSIAVPADRAAAPEGSERMRVLVTLAESVDRSLPRADFTTESGRQSWRSAVSSRQSEVLAMLPAGTHRVAARYENFMGLALEVNLEALDALLGDPLVQWVEPVRVKQRTLNQGISVMNGTAMRSTFRGAGVTVAIIDDGVDYTHPNLGGGGFPNAKVIGGIDTAGVGDSNPRNPSGAHGTACAGIAAGNVPNGGSVGDFIGGVAPDAKIAAVKVFPDGEDEDASDDDIIQGIDWCVTNQNLSPTNPIMVISMSLGGDRFFASCDNSSPAFVNAINAAIAAGITIVAASGNDGFCNSMSAPACFTGIISVGATFDGNIGNYETCLDSTTCHPGQNFGSDCPRYVNVTTAARQVTPYSNTASFLDILGPSDNSHTADIVGSAGYTSNNYITDFNGTSAATPYIAGAIAALQSAAKARRGSFYTPAEIRQLITSTGISVTDTKGGGLNPGITKPFMNMQAALDAIPTAGTPGLEVRDGGTLLANGGGPISFGSISQGAVAASRVFTVRNSGTADLTLSGLSVPGGFSITEGLSATLAPSTQDTFTVSMPSSAPGTFSGNVTFSNNVAGSSPFSFQITGTVNPVGGGTGEILLQYALETSVVPAGAGTVGRSPAPRVGNQYAANATVAVSASPAQGYVFRGWSGDATGTLSPTNVVMNANKAVRAAFAFPPVPNVRDAFEPNETFGDAQPLALNVPGSTSFANLVMENGGTDWYEINVPALTHLSIDLVFEPAQGSLSADLWDRRGVENPLAFGLAQAQDYTGTGLARLVYVNATAPERLYLRVFGAANPAYSLIIDAIEADDQYDRNGVDNNAPCSPSVIPTVAANTLHANLVLRDDDWFRVNLPPGTTLLDVAVNHRFFSGDLHFMVIGDDPADCAGAFSRVIAGGFSTAAVDNEVLTSIDVAGRTSVLVRVFGANLFMRNIYDLTVTAR